MSAAGSPRYVCAHEQANRSASSYDIWASRFFPPQPVRLITSWRQSRERNRWTPSSSRWSRLSARFSCSSTGCRSRFRQIKRHHSVVSLDHSARTDNDDWCLYNIDSMLLRFQIVPQPSHRACPLFSSSTQLFALFLMYLYINKFCNCCLPISVPSRFGC
jgi:hypothetical protein